MSNPDRKPLTEQQKAEARERARLYRQANADKIKAWREANRERLRKQSLDNYYANREYYLEKNREWIAAHKEHRKAQSVRYTREVLGHGPRKPRRPKEEQKRIDMARMAKWREKNRAHCIAYAMKYAQEHPEQTYANKVNDLARRRASGYTEGDKPLTAEHFKVALAEVEYACAYCRQAFNKRTLMSVDHLIPIIEGGRNTPENIVMCCRSCNSRKRSMPLHAFLQRNGLTNPHPLAIQREAAQRLAMAAKFMQAPPTLPKEENPLPSASTTQGDSQCPPSPRTSRKSLPPLPM
jgi:5-methylcytosine-specific restriction endonuclease McrA